RLRARAGLPFRPAGRTSRARGDAQVRVGRRRATSAVGVVPDPGRGPRHGLMFLLYAVLGGLILGLLVGGRPAGLANLQFRWAPLAILGFSTQVVLFADFASQRVGALGPPLYVATTAL